MRDRKSYRGARPGAGLKDEYNDIFKARALEKKGSTAQGNKITTTSSTTESKESKKTSSSSAATMNPARKKRVSYEQKLVKNTKNPKNDVFDMETSEDEVLEKSLKAKSTANTYQQRPGKKSKGDVFDIETSEEEVIDQNIKTKPATTTTKFQQRPEQSMKNKATSYQQPAKKVKNDVSDIQTSEGEARKSLKTVQQEKTVQQAKPAPAVKPVAEARNSKVSSARTVSNPIKLDLDSDSDSEPVRDRTIRNRAPVTTATAKVTKPVEKTSSKSDKAPAKPENVPTKAEKTLKADKAPPKAEKRKARASSDSESDYAAKPKTQKKKRKASPKETAAKRKAERDSDEEGVTKPAIKRQDRGTKAGGTGKKAGKPSKAEEPAVEANESEPMDFVYDHAVDLSYAEMSSPRKAKAPALGREPSAVEMPTGLAELIESRVAEIEEQVPVKKARKPAKRQPRRAEEELIELASDEMLPGSTGEKDADLQAQIHSAMFAADYGVRTTRSKFRNEGAAKKSYGVAQRTMRQPVTEEEQREDDKLELNRSREEAAKQAAKKAHYEEVLRKEKEEAVAAASSEGKEAKKGGKKGKKAAEKEANNKKKATSAYDLPEEEDDGPKVMSRHELLQKGRHQRVLNEINALMEDAQKENPTRRSSILDIAYKMSNNTDIGKEFTTKFRLNGYPSKLFINLQAEEDALTRIGYGWALFILLNEDRYSGHAVELMHSNGGFEMLKLMLQNDEDMEDLARSSVLKLQLQINIVTGKLRNRLLDCRFIRDDVPESFSQRYVALMIINTLLKNVSKDEGRKLIFSSFDPRQFVEILSPLNGHNSPPSGKILTNFILSASILSHYAQGARIYKPLNEALDPGHHTVLSNVLPTVLEWNTSDWMKDINRIKDLQTAVFKLCIDRTNDDPTTCTSVADHRNGLTSIVEICVRQFKKLSNNHDDEADTSKDVDILVLTTILLSNLLEFSETARMFLRIQLSMGTPLIKSLMGVFQQRHDRLELAESVEETHLNVAFGYLTVALAYACREYDTRVMVRTQLRGTLQPLVLAVTAFKNQNKTLEDAEAAVSEDVIQDIMLGEAAPTKYSYTARLEDILVELQSYGSR
ncbi:hypothetical protein TWF281_008819 [Arthrobotrys megalospora]